MFLGVGYIFKKTPSKKSRLHATLDETGNRGVVERIKRVPTIRLIFQ